LFANPNACRRANLETHTCRLIANSLYVDADAFVVEPILEIVSKTLQIRPQTSERFDHLVLGPVLNTHDLN